VIQQQFILVRNILPTNLQWPDGQFEKGKFRGDATEPAGLQAFDDFTGEGAEPRMALEMIDP
jgi:hypothetical protein